MLESRLVGFGSRAIRCLTESSVLREWVCRDAAPSSKARWVGESHFRSGIAGNSERTLTPFPIHGFVVAGSRTIKD